ncbi:hypothetical protein SAMN05192558_102489 [Actinokineospora alba]|uniref:Membrane domain of glycerophosphoryl diester phosphodiesterase n=1 Tax=Actinokineospora alba TaxID=504798 RepID=A0A1H0IBD7_9PSEU|nr:hypothetical protein [Actinokineospora alba]TDP71011.1 hypothetical protein C8E96_6645 [Actinokineospora alba]SDI88027.1 hypothetical protein SAMN05421871_108188 [Actinokineospora alba]SDO28693.1 hypothetical protein SAMN05192558_102489 [Actinokineospora alba]
MSTDNEALRLGIVPLRPLGLPDLVGGTVQALRRNPRALFGGGLLVAVIAELVTVAVTVLVVGGLPAAPTTEIPTFAELRPFLIATMIALLVVEVMALVLVGVVNVVVPRAVFGHVTGLRAALTAMLPKLPRLLGILAAIGAMMIGIAVIAVGAIVLGGEAGVLLAFPAVVAVVYLSMAFSFAASVAVVEDQGVIESLRRSRTLVHAVGWWRVFGILLLAGLATGIVAAIVGALFETVSGGSSLGTSLATVLTSAVFAPATTVLTTLLYVDHRCRSEGIEGLWREAA